MGFFFCTWWGVGDLYHIVSLYQHFFYEIPWCSTFMKCNYSATHTSLVYHMKNVFMVFPLVAHVKCKEYTIFSFPGTGTYCFCLRHCMSYCTPALSEYELLEETTVKLMFRHHGHTYRFRIALVKFNQPCHKISQARMIARQEDVTVIIVLFAADWVPWISHSQWEGEYACCTKHLAAIYTTGYFDV